MRSCLYLLVCFMQPHLRAGVKNLPSKTPPLFRICAVPVVAVRSAGLPHVSYHHVGAAANTHSPGPPPCLWQRPLALEVVVQSAMEQSSFFFPPPCFLQYGDEDCALVVHPANLHVPYAPCLAQTPRAAARVVQPSSLHTFLLPPPCL